MDGQSETGIDISYPSRGRLEKTAVPPRFDLDQIMNSLRGVAGVSESLRILGAAVLVASMSTFLLQGWNEGNDVGRYLMLLAQTGLLAGAGFALSHGLKEARGARVFFGLTLISIPANFTILGALIYSAFQWDGGLISYPDFAAWQVDTPASIGVTLLGAMIVLVPVTLFSFAVMARHSTKLLSLSFLATNVMLLLPIRDSLAAGSIALLSMFYAMYFAKSATVRDRALKTPEGRFALSMMFIPAAIILVRSMYLYQIDSLMIVMLSLAVFIAARQIAIIPGQSAILRRALEVISIPVAVVFSVAIGATLIEFDSTALILPVCALAYSALAFDVLHRTDSKSLAGFLSASISLSVATSFVWAVALEQSALAAVLCLIAGAVMLFAGVATRNRLASIGGALTVLGGGLVGFEPIAALVSRSGWMELAIFGACTIVVGSVLDRHGMAIKIRVTKWLGTINSRNSAIALND
jgi:hypothetical protein